MNLIRHHCSYVISEFKRMSPCRVHHVGMLVIVGGPFSYINYECFSLNVHIMSNDLLWTHRKGAKRYAWLDITHNWKV